MKTKYILLSILAIGLATVSCKKEEGCTDVTATNYDADAEKDDGSCEFGPPSYDTKIMFMPKFGTADFAYNSNFTDGSGNTVQFSRLNFYISSPQIMGLDDEIYSDADGVMLFTMDNKTFDLGNIQTEIDHWHEVNFNIGVPANLNTQDGADAKDPSEYSSEHPLSFQSPNMHWSWNSGYIFIAIEGMVDVNGDNQTDSIVEYHVGGNDYLSSLNLMLHEDVSVDNVDIHVNIDLEKLFEGIDMSTERVTHTMDNMPLANKIKANVSSAFSIESH